MAGLIYRYESIAKTLFKRDKGDTWKYIFVSQDVQYQGEEAIDVWQGRIKGIKLQIERYHKKQEQWQDNWKEEWQNKNEDWQKKNEEQLKKNEDWQKKNEERIVAIEQAIKEVKEENKKANEENKLAIKEANEKTEKGIEEILSIVRASAQQVILSEMLEHRLKTRPTTGSEQPHFNRGESINEKRMIFASS